MSFQTLNTRTEAQKLKTGSVVTGYLLGCRIIPSKKKGEKASVILIMQDKKSGQQMDVWANGVLKYQCLNDKGNGIKDELRGVMLRFTGGKKVKIPGAKSPMLETKVEIDSADKIRGGKDYVLNPAKKYQKRDNGIRRK